MVTTPEHDARIAALTVAAIYPQYVLKVERKGRTEAELLQVITWLTGYSPVQVKKFITSGATLAEFFDQAKLHPNASLITGTICGYKIQDITTPLTKQVRYLDKLVDELAKGRPLEKIIR